MANEEAGNKRVNVGLSVSREEHRALEFVKAIHGDKYDGVASVLNDYSVASAVLAHRLALASLEPIQQAS